MSGGNYSNATTSTLSVNTAGNFGDGRYRCKIGGDLASTVFTDDEGLFVNQLSLLLLMLATVGLVV